MDNLYIFWKDGMCVEWMRDKGTRTLLAAMNGGCLRFGEVDWAEPQPVAKTITEREALERWQSV